jgi:hypothetical protein
MSYESENWPRLSPAFREAHNRLRHAKGQSPIPPPVKDLYVAPPPRPMVQAVDASDPELQAEYRASTARFDAVLRGGAEGFQINGSRVEGLEVVELPRGMGYEGITEGRRGDVHVTEGFTIRR